ncbi:MAG: hypothetical protein NVS4B2_05080 [Chloroflexota bacterium]
MPAPSSRPQREREAFAPDERPDADSFVYCKGCGKQLESRARLAKPKAVVDAMMCESCQQQHNHALMPSPGAPTYCYRCGSLEEVYVAPGVSPATYHICARCLPDRAARYRSGDFEVPQKVAVPEAESAPAQSTSA